MAKKISRFFKVVILSWFSMSDDIKEALENC